MTTSAEKIRQIAKLYNGGDSIREVADKLFLGRRTVWQYLTTLGIKRKPGNYKPRGLKEKSPNWKGGKGDFLKEIAHSTCAKSGIDMTKCTKCGRSILDRLPDVHHIDKNKCNNNIKNLMVLCSSCHAKLHWQERRMLNEGR